MNTSLLAASLFSGDLLGSIGSVAGWAFLGVILTVCSLKLFDLITPGNLHEQVFKDRNQAAATVYAAALLSSAIIIASALH